MTLEAHPDRRTESCIAAAERLIEKHSEDGVTPQWGGVMRQMISLLMSEAEKVERVRRYAQDRAGYRPGTVSSLRIASDLNNIVGGVEL